MQSRVFNAKRNIVWGIVEKIVTLFLPFFTRTLIIKVLGEEYLGLGSLFSSVIQVLNLTELGFGSAMVFHMYKYVADQDTDGMCAILNFYRSIYRMMGGLILTCGLIILPFIPKIIAGTVPQDINVYYLYLIYLFTTVSSYWLFAYKNSVLYASQRTDIQSNINTIVQIVVSVLQIIGLVITKNYYFYAYWILLSVIIKNIITSIIVDKYYPQYVCKGEITKETKQSIYKKLRALLGHKLGGVVLSAADNIVISAFLGLTIVARYNNYFYLNTAVVGMLTIVYNAITAGVGNSIAKESIEKNYNDFKKFSFLNVWIVGWCAICFACLYQPFISIWIGEQYLMTTGTMLLFVVYFAVNQLRKIVLMYKDSAGLWEADALKPYVETAFNLVLNIILVQYMGVNGVLISSILAMTVIDIPWEIWALFHTYFVGKRKIEYWIFLFKYVILFLGIGTLTYYVSLFGDFNGLLRVIVIALECLIIPNCLVIALLNRSQLFKDSVTFMKRVVLSKKR